MRTYHLVYAIGNAGMDEFPLAFFLKEEVAWKFREEVDRELEVISRFFNIIDVENFKKMFPSLDWDQLDGVYVDCVAIDQCVIADAPIQLALLPDGT